MAKKRGVIILAIGHPYYGCYAAQLARSIRATDPDVELALAHAHGSTTHLPTLAPFDHVIEIPAEYTHTNGLPDYFKAKTFIYELSPFDTTIGMDADTIWLPRKPISQLFDQLDGLEFTMAPRGAELVETATPGLIHWADPQEIRAAYNIPDGELLFNLSSEFMYFKKNKRVKKLFTEAQKIFTSPLVQYKTFGHTMPDELAFAIAMMKTKVYPPREMFLPIYWEQYEKKNMAAAMMYETFWAYSLGGNMVTREMKQFYGNLANHYNKKFGISGYFDARDKRSFLSERTSI